MAEERGVRLLDFAAAAPTCSAKNLGWSFARSFRGFGPVKEAVAPDIMAQVSQRMDAYETSREKKPRMPHAA
jgi:hypothetical protein